MEPEVRYCTTTDGVRIAYTVTGSGPPLLTCVEPIASHVQLEWTHIGSGRILRAQAQHSTLIRLDFRGSGLSDRVLPRSIDDSVLDLEAVVERTGLQRFALSANLSASLAAIVFAARHPEQVTRMIITDGFLRMRDTLNAPQLQALQAAARVDWTLATEAVAYVAYGSDRDENRAHGEFIRACIGPEYFAEGIVADLASIDVSDSARRVQAPTLVMSHSGLQFITMEMTRELVTLIPNAQLAIIEGTWSDNVEAMLDRAIAFLYPGAEIPPRASGIPSGTATQTGLTVILFADIVDSTALTERLGDTAFRNKARDLDATLRAIIRDHAGTPIEGKLLGDGVLAVFTSARQAIEAALVCGRSGHDTGLPLHLGLHAGDVIREENPDGRSNVYGGAVNIAARISGLSVPGQLLVSDTVRSLARTSAGVRFAGHGEHSLKGIEEPVRVYEVREG